MLNNNIIGTPGKSMVYQHQKVNEKLDHIAAPNFVSLSLRDNLLGTCCFCRRQVLVDGESVLAYYIRYFTFKEPFRSDARKKIHQSKDNLLKKEVDQLLQGEAFEEKEPHIYYGYIDPDNVRSMRFAQEFHFEKAGVFHTVFFSRFFPKRHGQVYQLKENDRKNVSQWIKRTYALHQFFCEENIFYKQGYYVIKHKGEIVAGLQAVPEKWRIYELPGKNGRRLLSLVSRFPFLNRLFNKEFDFLSVEAIICKQGHEKDLEALLSDVLARHQVHTAIMCLDPNSREYRIVKSLKPGLISKLADEKRLQAMVRSQGCEKPSDGFIYVSTFDVM